MKRVSILVLVLALVISMIPMAISDSGWDGPCLHTCCKILISNKTKDVAQLEGFGGKSHHTRKYHEKYHCEECDTEFWGDRWEPESHGSWSKYTIVSNATCGKDGSKYHTCGICKQKVYVTIPATGKHNWGSWTLIETPSGSNHGKLQRRCTVCKKTETKPCY